MISVERLCDEAVVTAAMVHGVSPTAILGRSRKGEIVRARRDAMRRAYDAGLRQSEIARYFECGASAVHQAVRASAPRMQFKSGRGA